MFSSSTTRRPGRAACCAAGAAARAGLGGGGPMGTRAAGAGAAAASAGGGAGGTGSVLMLAEPARVTATFPALSICTRGPAGRCGSGDAALLLGARARGRVASASSDAAAAAVAGGLPTGSVGSSSSPSLAPGMPAPLRCSRLPSPPNTICSRQGTGAGVAGDGQAAQAKEAPSHANTPAGSTTQRLFPRSLPCWEPGSGGPAARAAPAWTAPQAPSHPPPHPPPRLVHCARQHHPLAAPPAAGGLPAAQLALAVAKQWRRGCRRQQPRAAGWALRW